MTRQLRVLIADDHVPTRVGIRLALEEEGFATCAEAETGRAAVEAARRERPDVCLLDINMPGGGIAAAAAIASALPETKIVMLTGSREDEDLFAALEAGASGYLYKDLDPERLGSELRGVVAGEASLAPGLAARVLEEFGARARRGWLPVARRRDVELTSRELEVLECMRDGLDTSTIGERLFIAPTTVRRHVASILKKLQVPSREAAVRLLDRQERQRSQVG